ncbi:MAG: glycosyltransferase family 4 protein [Anaerolineaceae bacterium]|nr:glycosyltransferase family 4 protein [Anaerolineaceae bacterium]
MQVNISGITTFHVYNLAMQMQQLGLLKTYYTALPASRTPGISNEKVKRIPILLGPIYLARKLGLGSMEMALEKPARDLFKRWLAANITSCDVFHSLSGFGLSAFPLVKNKYNAATICDRGSTHILFQDEILQEEHKLWGIPYKRIDPEIIDAEISEYETCDLITVPSKFVHDTFLAKGVPPNKLAVIPYGVDLDTFHPLDKTDKVFRAIYVGQISLRKGIPYLLQAFANINLPGFELQMIGKLAVELKDFFRNNKGNCIYLGPKPRAELYQWYSGASVFVIASIEEGLATVIAQAMACGLPVVATRNTGAEELITDGVEGFIVSPRDPAALQEKVLYLYKNPDIRLQMAHAALEKVKRLGGWDDYGNRIATTYQNICDKNKMNPEDRRHPNSER